MEADEVSLLANQLMNRLGSGKPGYVALVEPTAEQLAEWEAKSKAREERDAIARARDEAYLEQQLQLQAKRQLEKSLSTLPPSAQAALDGELDATPAVKAAMSWVDGDKRVLLLRGGVGVGKTLAAAVAARHGVEKHAMHSVSWHSPGKFASGVLHSYAEDAPKVGRDLVIIDDVGREMRADFGEALCSFLDEKSARILMTTNLSKEQFRERYDPRLIDRLGEIGAAVTVKGESRRRNTGGL